MHSQQQQQPPPPQPSQSSLQSQHHNHHHHHHHQHQHQQSLPPQQQPPSQSQSLAHGAHSEQQLHYHAQSHHHSLIDHSHVPHHVNQSQQQTHPQHRQQHQQHPQQQQQHPHHQQSHHPHHHHHQMQPTQPHHHMPHHGMAPMMPYAQNIIYQPHTMGHHAFPTTGHIAPPSYNHAPAPNHGADPIIVNNQTPPQPQPQPQSQAQPQKHPQPQPQPQTHPSSQQPPLKQQPPQQPLPQSAQPTPGNVNPANMPQISPIPPTVMGAPNVSNTGVHPIGNGPMLDTHMQNRMAIPPHWSFVPGPYNMPPQMMHFPVHQNYHGAHMPAPNPPMMATRLPIDIRPPYDLQNHAGPPQAKVPLSQAPPIITKPPNSIPPATGVVQPAPKVAQPLKPRVKQRLAIVDPVTKHAYTDDELKDSASKSSTLSTDTSASPATSKTTANSTSITTATPTTIAPTQVTVPKDDNTTSSQTSSSESPAVVATQTATIPESSTPPKEPTQAPATNVSPPISSATSSSALLPDDKQPSAKEQFTTSNAIGIPTVSAIIDKTQVMSISESQNNTSPTNSTVSKPVVQANSNDVRISQTDVVDRAVPHEEECDTDKQDLKLVGDKENNHACVDRVEVSAKKLNPSLPYSEGQYSPINPTGRRKYTIEFLKAVGDTLHLEDREINNDLFVPDFLQGRIQGDNYGIPRRSSQQTLNNKQPVRRIIATQSLQPEASFKTAENPWKPELDKEKTKAVETGEIDTQRLLKLFRGLLNKITPQKYDSIIEKIEALNLDGDDRLKSVIDLVFDKAVDEPGFCELYARMSKVIASRNSQFNHHLLKKCQDEFETNDLYSGLNVETREQDIENEIDPTKKKYLSDELYEDMRIRRKKYLGTIKLIGEMYKLDLLVPKIIGFCIARLTNSPSNENLECLCSLMATVGAKMANEKDDSIKGAIKNTITVLNDFATNKKTDELFTLESRIKFKILDTIDLSRKNWRPRMVENNPKKLSEIHEEIKPRQQVFSRNTIKNNDSIVPPRRNIQNQPFMRR